MSRTALGSDEGRLFRRGRTSLAIPASFAAFPCPEACYGLKNTAFSDDGTDVKNRPNPMSAATKFRDCGNNLTIPDPVILALSGFVIMSFETRYTRRSKRS